MADLPLSRPGARDPDSHTIAIILSGARQMCLALLFYYPRPVNISLLSAGGRIGGGVLEETAEWRMARMR